MSSEHHQRCCFFSDRSRKKESTSTHVRNPLPIILETMRIGSPLVYCRSLTNSPTREHHLSRHEKRTTIEQGTKTLVLLIHKSLLVVDYIAKMSLTSSSNRNGNIRRRRRRRGRGRGRIRYHLRRAGAALIPPPAPLLPAATASTTSPKSTSPSSNIRSSLSPNPLSSSDSIGRMKSIP